MAQFENIDPLAFLGVECSIPIGEIITASRKLDYLNSMVAKINSPAASVPASSAIPQLPLPVVLPQKSIIINEGTKSSNFWFWAIVVVGIIIIGGIIWYLIRKNKKEEEARLKELALASPNK